MVAGRRTGRLPHSAWPKVLQRHLLGERADAIARDLGCSTAAVVGALRRFRPILGERAVGIGVSSNWLAGVDPALASRLTGAMIRFIETLDAARHRPTRATIDDLHEASDRLMRVIARVRLVVERATQDRGR